MQTDVPRSCYSVKHDLLHPTCTKLPEVYSTVGFHRKRELAKFEHMDEILDESHVLHLDN